MAQGSKYQDNRPIFRRCLQIKPETSMPQNQIQNLNESFICFPMEGSFIKNLSTLCTIIEKPTAFNWEVNYIEHSRDLVF